MEENNNNENNFIESTENTNNEIKAQENEEIKEENVVNQEKVNETNKNAEDETINTFRISNEAIATYAGIAVVEIPGVYGMAGTFAGITEAISGKKNYSKGIKIEATEKTVKIDVNIIVEYGARIPEIAFDIQRKVKKSVETMTGLRVLEVNVNVQGVHATLTDKNEENVINKE